MRAYYVGSPKNNHKSNEEIRAEVDKLRDRIKTSKEGKKINFIKIIFFNR